MRRLKNYQTERSNPRRFAVLKVTAKQAAVARHSYPPEGIASKLIVDKACDRLGRPERRPFSISPPMSAPNVICAQFKQTVRKLDAMLRTVARRANFHDFFRSARPQAPKLELRLTRRGVFARSVRNPLARIRVENRRLLRERGRRAGGAQEGPELGWRRHQRPQRRLAPLARCPERPKIWDF